jgi:hypothetical protein
MYEFGSDMDKEKGRGVFKGIKEQWGIVLSRASYYECSYFEVMNSLKTISLSTTCSDWGEGGEGIELCYF